MFQWLLIGNRAFPPGTFLRFPCGSGQPGEENPQNWPPLLSGWMGLRREDTPGGPKLALQPLHPHPFTQQIQGQHTPEQVLGKWEPTSHCAFHLALPVTHGADQHQPRVESTALGDQGLGRPLGDAGGSLSGKGVGRGRGWLRVR